MKRVIALLAMALLVLGVVPAVMAVHVGGESGVEIITEDFAPRVWMCDDRVWIDDEIQPQPDGQLLRENNYAFEGEAISWDVLVMDKNKIDQNIDVYATIGDIQGEGNDIEVNCIRSSEQPEGMPKTCNARIQEEHVKWNPDTMAMFECTLTVETSESMYGEYWITVEAMDGDGEVGTMDENEYWFLNPVIALTIDGDITFDEVRPGTDSYSETLLVGNDADDGSGVLLDMFISGTDFYDSDSSGARCSDLGNGPTNALALSAFRYFGTNGAFSTKGRGDCGGLRAAADSEGYVGIAKGNRIAQACEIIGNDQFLGAVNSGNVLTPGSEMALTFKLSLPEPCNGDFDTGSIYFWGEAI